MSKLLNASSNLRNSFEGPESTKDIIRRIEMRQSHAISNLKLRKTLRGKLGLTLELTKSKNK
jgi:hypothetical protein